MNTTTARGSLLAALASVLVGGSFTANSLLGDYPYAGGQFLRYWLAFPLLLPLAGPGATDRLRALGPGPWLRLALLAAVGMVGFNLAVLAAERGAEQAVPGVFVGCAPVLVAVLVPLLDRRRPKRAVSYGASLVAAGAFTRAGGAPTARASPSPSARCWARSGSPSWPCPCCGPLGPRLLSTTVCAIAAAQSAVAGVLTDGAGWLRAPDAVAAGALLWQAPVVTVVGLVCWYMGMQRIGAERATLFSGLIPVAAACTTPLVGTGSYGAAQAAGSALACAGAALRSGAPLPFAGRRGPRASRAQQDRTGGQRTFERSSEKL